MAKSYLDLTNTETYIREDYLEVTFDIACYVNGTEMHYMVKSLRN